MLSIWQALCTSVNAALFLLNVSDVSVVPHMLVFCYHPGMVTGGRHALVQATLLNCIFCDTI